MPPTILEARERQGTITIRVHLDPSKMIDGEPDPAWVREWQWGSDPPAGVTRAAYRASIRQEIKRQVSLMMDEPGIGALVFPEGEQL